MSSQEARTQVNERMDIQPKSVNYDVIMFYDFFHKFLYGITTPKLPGILALVDFVIGQEFPVSNFFVQQSVYYCRNETFSSGPVWSVINCFTNFALSEMKPPSIRNAEEIVEKQKRNGTSFPSLLPLVVPLVGYVCGLLLRDKFQGACEQFAKHIVRVVRRV